MHARRTILQGIVLLALAWCVCGDPKPGAMGRESPPARASTPRPVNPGEPPMMLGNFSISLAVKDLAASRAFYEKLGFHVFGGDPAQGWLTMQNDSSTIGLFQGLFEHNILTFNPGWDRAAATLPAFDDVRDLQRHRESEGLTLTTRADESSTGPASITLTDPDGNMILIDQHVPRPTTPPAQS